MVGFRGDELGPLSESRPDGHRLVPGLLAGRDERRRAAIGNRNGGSSSSRSAELTIGDIDEGPFDMKRAAGAAEVLTPEATFTTLGVSCVSEVAGVATAKLADAMTALARREPEPGVGA